MSPKRQRHEAPGLPSEQRLGSVRGSLCPRPGATECLRIRSLEPPPGGTCEGTGLGRAGRNRSLSPPAAAACLPASRHRAHRPGRRAHRVPLPSPAGGDTGSRAPPPQWGRRWPPCPPQRQGPFVLSTQPRSAACLELSTHPPVPRRPFLKKGGATSSTRKPSFHRLPPQGGPDVPGHLVLPKPPLCASLCPWNSDADADRETWAGRPGASHAHTP